MRRWLGAIFAAAALGLCGCTDPSVTGAAAGQDAAATTVGFQQAMSSEEAAAFADLDVTEPREVTAPETPEVASPVPVYTATPGPSESFAYSDDTISVRYYDMDTMQAHATQFPVTDASDPQAVLDGVQAAYEGLLGNDSVRINGATYSDGNLFVDFDPSIYDLSVGSAGEMQILESVADTYLTNIDGIRAVFYTVNGEPYNSENISTAANEAYKTADSVSS